MNVENDFLIWHRGELTSSGMFHQILYCLSSLAFFMHIVPLVALCCEIFFHIIPTSVISLLL